MKLNIKDAPQQALGFLLAQTSHIERQVLEVKYPDITYAELIPVDTTAHPYARSVTYFSTDKVGKAAWLAGAGAGDFPMADINREKHETSVAMAGIGYQYSLDELGEAQMLGQNLTADKGMAARRAYEEHVEDVAFSGDTNKGFEGLTGNSNVTAASAPNGAGGTPGWTTKTPDEILKDINDAISGVWTGSNTVEMADTVLIPLTQFALIANTRIGPDTGTTILEHIARANVYTATTGQPLKIRAMRQLAGKGAGATDRMMAYRRNPEVLKLHVPMPLRFLTAQQVLLNYIVPGMFRLGGLDIRRPGSCRYVDAI